jgi:predicted ABC-type ATPase
MRSLEEKEVKEFDYVLRTCQPIVDSWVIFDNSEDIPKMIAFKESGKLEIIDSASFDMLLKYKDQK